MTIEIAYYIAQIIAALAILGTLYYGVQQIGHNNELARIAHINMTMNGYIDFNLRLAETPQISRVWELGIKADPSLTEDEKRQFNMICYAAFYGYEGQLEMRESPMAGDLFLRGQSQMRHILTMPGVQEWWTKARPNFREDFQVVADGIIAAHRDTTGAKGTR